LQLNFTLKKEIGIWLEIIHQSFSSEILLSFQISFIPKKKIQEPILEIPQLYGTFGVYLHKVLIKLQFWWVIEELLMDLGTCMDFLHILLNGLTKMEKLIGSSFISKLKVELKISQHSKQITWKLMQTMPLEI